jgi:hypothetical protein
MEFYTKYYYVFSRFIKFNVYMSSQEFQQKLVCICMRFLHIYMIFQSFMNFWEYLND